MVENLTMAYGDFVIQRDLNFTINKGDIFIIMGGSGCGKSTLLRHLIGLQAPARGRVLFKTWTVKNSAINKAGRVGTLSYVIEIVPPRIFVYKLGVCSAWHTEPKYSDDDG